MHADVGVEHADAWLCLANAARQIVICNLGGPGSVTLIGIKVTDLYGPTAVSRLHSDTTRHTTSRPLTIGAGLRAPHCPVSAFV